MSSGQIHAWVSQGSKAEFEYSMGECQKALAGLESNLLLLAKYVLSISALNLSLVIAEYWMRFKMAGNQSRGAKKPAV